MLTCVSSGYCCCLTKFLSKTHCQGRFFSIHFLGMAEEEGRPFLRPCKMGGALQNARPQKGQQRQRSDEENKERKGVEKLKNQERCCTPHTSLSLSLSLSLLHVLLQSVLKKRRRKKDGKKKDVRKSKRWTKLPNSPLPHLLGCNGGRFPRLRNSISPPSSIMNKHYRLSSIFIM